MVSDFVEEHGGFLKLSDKEFEQAKRTNLILSKVLVNFSSMGP